MQAVLHRYESFDVAHGHTLELPMDRGEGQQWRRAPGNVLSTPVKVSFDPASQQPIALRFDQVIAPVCSASRRLHPKVQTSPAGAIEAG